MKVLITGASGFMGSHLARLLVDEGCQVFGQVQRESNLWRIKDLQGSMQLLTGDLLLREQIAGIVDQARPDLCVHLAWYAEPGVYQTSPLNTRYIDASLNLATLLAQAGCKRLVAAGTCAEYDADYGYLSETSPTRPVTLYAASKVALYTVLAKLAEKIGLEVAWARIFYVYGPREDERRFIPAIINSLLRNEPTRLTPGEQVRDYLHVEDVANALWAVARSALTDVVNVGSGRPVTNRDIALKLGVILERPNLVKFGDLPYRAGDPMFVCSDNRRLLANTDWTPKYDIESGLRQTAAWWREKLNAGV